MLPIRRKLITKLLDLDQSTEEVNTGENFNTNLRAETSSGKICGDSVFLSKFGRNSQKEINHS